MSGPLAPVPQLHLLFENKEYSLMPQRAHGPENAEFELRKAYNSVVEGVIPYLWENRAVQGVHPYAGR